jgi:hypothetical protein
MILRHVPKDALLVKNTFSERKPNEQAASDIPESLKWILLHDKDDLNSPGLEMSICTDVFTQPGSGKIQLSTDGLRSQTKQQSA